MMNKTISYLMAMVSMLAISYVAWAAPDTQTPPSPRPLEELFNQVDTAHSGKLDSKAYQQFQALQQKKMEERMQERMKQMTLPDFATLDKDKKGFVTLDDIRSAMRAEHPRGHKGMHGMRGDREHGGCQGDKPAGLFAQADVGHKGSLTKEEYQQFLKLRQQHLEQMLKTPAPDFATLDKNGDGKLTPKELHEGMMQQACPVKQGQ